MRLHRRSESTPGAPAAGNAFDLGVAQVVHVEPGTGRLELELDLLVRIPDDQVLLIAPRPELVEAGLTPTVAFTIVSAHDPIRPPRLSVGRPERAVRLEPGVPYARALVLAAPLERFYFDPTLPDELAPEQLGASTADPIVPDELRT
jgi:hypothetical protein